MVRKLSLICAVAGALVFPVIAFAAEGDNHKHENDQGQHQQNGTTIMTKIKGATIINATLTITITIIRTLGTGTMGAIGTTP